MVKATMIGHVELVDVSGNYENSFIVTDEKMPDTKFVNHVKFLVSSKKTELMDKFKIGDKVRVTFYVTGVEGESKKTELMDKFKIGDKVKVTFYVTGIAGESQKTGKPYQINKLMVS